MYVRPRKNKDRVVYALRIIHKLLQKPYESTHDTELAARAHAGRRRSIDSLLMQVEVSAHHHFVMANAKITISRSC
jgi:hypothetical protein